MSRAVVIGGGIGGLTAAVALSLKGWDVTICERAGSLEPVGSGLAVAPNALKALDTIGAGDKVRELAAMQGQAGVRASDGRWLLRTSAEAVMARFGDPTVLLLRATLVDLLARRLPAGALRLGTSVETADPGTGRVVTGQGDLDADLIVAADGINSAVRRALFPSHPAPVHSGVTSWRVVVPSPEPDLRSSETWGRGQVFGVMPLADGLVYCYATAPAGRAADVPGGKRRLTALFSGWHDPIPRLLAAARENEILEHDIFALPSPPPAFHAGRVALLGDAAHAMTPNMGQGACQAIEDAVVLAHVAGAPGAAPVDLAPYTAARRARTAGVMRRSWTLCRLTQWSNPLAVRARDTVMTLAGRLAGDVSLRQFDDVFTWRPPAS